MRGDLSPGYQLAQSNHSAIEFAIHFPRTVKKWHETSNYIACVSARDEDHLLDLCRQAVDKGLKCSLFREPDIDDQATALAIEPCEDAREILKGLPLALSGGSGINKRRFSSAG